MFIILWIDTILPTKKSSFLLIIQHSTLHCNAYTYNRHGIFSTYRLVPCITINHILVFEKVQLEKNQISNQKKNVICINDMTVIIEWCMFLWGRDFLRWLLIFLQHDCMHAGYCRYILYGWMVVDGVGYSFYFCSTTTCSKKNVRVLGAEILTSQQILQFVFYYLPQAYKLKKRT